MSGTSLVEAICCTSQFRRPSKNEAEGPSRQTRKPEAYQEPLLQSQSLSGFQLRLQIFQARPSHQTWLTNHHLRTYRAADEEDQSLEPISESDAPNMKSNLSAMTEVSRPRSRNERSLCGTERSGSRNEHFAKAD